ncbi:MAG: efflux RND transporter periplasmic adaptor subunit [Gammaproteobacteria bacterium]
MPRKIVILSVFLLSSTFFLSNSLAKESAAKNMQFVPSVEVAKVEQVVQGTKVKTSGAMRATQGIMVRPEIDGRITEITFKPGDTVIAGTKLFQLNPEIYQGQVDQYTAELKLAKQDYDRSVRIYAEHVISDSDMDKSRANLYAKKGALEQAEGRLHQTNIKAAFTGTIGVNIVNLGDYVKPGQDLVSLQAIDPIEVEFGVPQVYMGGIALGNDVLLHVDSYPNEHFSGKVSAIDSIVNSANRNVIVRALVPNKDKRLLPGVYADVTLSLSNKKPTILIPQTAVVYDAGDVYAYIVLDNKAVKKTITLGESDQHNIEVKSGLKQEDTVITAGQQKIFDGCPVNVVTAKAPATK